MERSGVQSTIEACYEREPWRGPASGWLEPECAPICLGQCLLVDSSMGASGPRIIVVWAAGGGIIRAQVPF